jgi:hypothetical protein
MKAPGLSGRKRKRPALRFDPHRFRLSSIDRVSGAELEGVSFKNAFFGNFAGHEIVVSPDGAFAALFLYSGQSEVGWELFALLPRLKRLRGLPLQFGHADRPVFSPDSCYLIMAATSTMKFTDRRGQSFDEVEIDEQERISKPWLVEWADLWVQELPAHSPRRFRVAVRLPAGFEDDPCEWEIGRPRFLTGRRLALKMPWGTVAVQVPPPRPKIVFAMGARSPAG